jgi:hypothetical protein
VHCIHTIFPVSEFFSFHPSVIKPRDCLSLFSLSIFTSSLSSVALYFSDRSHVTDVYEGMSLSFPLRHVRKPTNPLQYLSTQQKFQYMQWSSWGRARDCWVLVDDRQLSFDSHCACINMHVLCFRGREREREILQWFSLVLIFHSRAQVIWPRNGMYFVFIVLTSHLVCVLHFKVLFRDW